MTRYERELRALLTDLGYGVMRAPASGSGGTQDLPDILAGSPAIGPDGERLSAAWAIEHKSGGDTTLYVEESEVTALTAFADAFGATPYLAARFTSRGTPTAHWFVRPENARKTDAGLHGLPIEDIEERASMKFEP